MAEPPSTNPPYAEFQKRLLGHLQRAWEEGRMVVGEAFEAGRIAGKNEAAAELRAKMLGVLQEHKADEEEEEEEEEGRAARGTVRPTVIEALRKYGEPGLKPAEIAARTGLNENSVRGALNKLKEEGITDKRGDLWVLVAKK